jgi:RNA polymerase sigma-70 factor, ECF subfamily
VDHEYVKFIEKWDDESFHRFMEQYGQDVWNYAYIMTKNREIADDISQEVFIKAYFQISRFRGQSSFKTWLLSITRNLALNHFRSAFFRKVMLVNLFSSKETSR